jgi:hypothetical protein
MTALSQTRTAVRQISQHAPIALTRTRAMLLDQQLTACTTAPPPCLLRQIVIAVRNLVGPSWLAAHATDPDISAFTHLDTTAIPPPLPLLDHILARCLQARFGPVGASALASQTLAGRGRSDSA